jgi:hypothetical protein
MDKIFVQIASYRDPELIPTIEDMLAKANNPEALTFGICWQYDSSEPIDHFDDDPRFRVSKHHYYDSEGLGWARAITNKLYDGEKYTLQIDSHHRFVQGWDTIIGEDYNQALLFAPKPIITTYCAPFNPQEDPSTWNPIPCLMSQYEFSSDKLLMSMPWYIQDYKERDCVIRARTISGHFYFTEGTFITEVPYDPRIYFGGYTEETTLSVRAYTNGYDMFSPYRTVMWHEYSRGYRVKHWDDHGHKNDNVKVTSGERDDYARKITRQLFRQEDNKIPEGIFGLGTHRTLHDYETYGGFNFLECKIQDYTLQVKEPPNPLPWHEQFKTSAFELRLEWDVDHFKNDPLQDIDVITLGVTDQFGTNIYRKDFAKDTDPSVFNFTYNSHLAKFNSTHPPKELVMFGLRKSDSSWTARYSKQL